MEASAALESDGGGAPVAAELCNGLDDDSDGLVDEGLGTHDCAVGCDLRCSSHNDACGVDLGCGENACRVTCDGPLDKEPTVLCGPACACETC